MKMYAIRHLPEGTEFIFAELDENLMFTSGSNRENLNDSLIDETAVCRVVGPSKEVEGTTIYSFGTGMHRRRFTSSSTMVIPLRQHDD